VRRSKWSGSKNGCLEFMASKCGVVMFPQTPGAQYRTTP
jgi:hypothetical protein